MVLTYVGMGKKRMKAEHRWEERKIKPKEIKQFALIFGPLVYMYID